MTDFRTIKAKECCCGCTLRTGSLILFWLILITDTIQTLYYLTIVVYGDGGRYLYYGSATVVKISTFYYLLWSLAGMIASLLGIFGIQKMIPKHLTFGLYYLLFYVIHFLLLIVLLLFFPTTFKAFVFNGSSYFYSSPTVTNFKLIGVIGLLFFIVLTLYFALIIRSCRDSMAKNLANNKAREVPDPVAVGYSAAY